MGNLLAATRLYLTMYQFGDDNGYLGGCGPACACKGCRKSTQALGFAEGADAMYLNQGPDELQSLDFAEQYADASGVGETRAKRRACGPYVRGEVARSKTQRGHLNPDVRQLRSGRLLIADFGVGWGSVKRSTQSEALLRRWLRNFERETSFRLRIVGYSDCVGNERRNVALRRRRAHKVRRLLGPSARSRVTFVGAAPAGAQVPGTDMSTVEGRALNRAVLIEFQQEFTFPPMHFSVPKRDLPGLLRRSIKLVSSEAGKRKLGRHPAKRLGCMLLKLLRRGTDDRFITAQSVLDYRNLSYRRKPSYSNAKQWLDLKPDISDEALLRRLSTIDDMIIQGRHKVNQLHATQGASVHVRVREIRRWIAGRERDPKSIYTCYSGRK